MYFSAIGIRCGGEVVDDLLLQQQPDVLVQQVARGIARGLRRVEQVLSGPFGHDDQGVAPVEDPLSQGGQEPALAVQGEGDLGDQREVDLLAGQRRDGGDEARVAAHHLHQADAVDGAPGFDVGAAEDLVGLLDGRHQPERLLAIGDVVVDRLGDADDGDLESAAGDFLVDAMGAALGAVAADAEEHVDALALEEIDDHAGVLLAPRRAEHRAALFVDLVDELHRERDRRLALVQILKRTRLGLEVRAVAQNRNMAKAMGIPTAKVDAMTFGLGSGIAGVAGVALSQITNVGPNLGQAYIVDSFMVVVFGGVGNLLGTLVAGFSLGDCQQNPGTLCRRGTG